LNIIVYLFHVIVFFKIHSFLNFCALCHDFFTHQVLSSNNCS
jgi:hypothetical protein